MTPQPDWFANVVGITRIELPAIGGWIEVRNELSVGDERKAFGSAIKGQTRLEDGKVRTEYDHEKLAFALAVAYIVDWSAQKDGKPIAFSADALRALKPSIYQVLEDAVDAHVKTMRAQRDEGNAPTSSASGAAPTSVSAA